MRRSGRPPQLTRAVPIAAAAPRRRRSRPLSSLWVWTYAAGLLGLVIGLRLGADTNPLLTVVAYGPLWSLAAPLAWLAVRSRRAGPLAILGLAASMALLVGPVTGLTVSGLLPHAAAPAGTPLRVMTVNLGSRLLDAVAFGRIVELERPDLVLMQECTERADYAFTDPAWYYRDDDALCLASRYPVRHVRVRYRTATPADDAFVAQYRVELPTGMVDVINVHLDTPRGGVHGLVAGLGWLDGLRANIAARREQARWVRQWLGEGGSMPRTIVAGDFNLTVESAIYGEAWSGFRNAFSERGLGWGYTKRETWFWGARIDHVLVGEGWAVANAWTAADVGSDHRPVVADLVLEADGAPRQ